jgi:5-(carboxyamino)imidazole ribonucleotide synthase
MAEMQPLGAAEEIKLGGSKELTLGVMGGGQLGRMFAHAAQRMGFFTAVLDPDPVSPAGRVSHHHIQTSYTDPVGLERLALVSQAITTEFENVPAAACVAIAQNRAAEKAHFVSCGVPCAPYAVIETPEQLAAVADNLLPGILKTARMGYDGKGQARVTSRAELAEAWADMQQLPCVLEKMLPLQLECSVIVARAANGDCVNLPLQRNLHRDGILAVTEVYAGNVPDELAARAIAAAKAIAAELEYVGVLCVEFFVLDESNPAALGLGGLVVNEMAPRPHNSGHYSMDACDVSQFELQVRTLAGLPLVQPRQHSPAIMLNLLGDIWPEGGVPAWDQVLALPGTHLHLYGKLRAAKGRKMGHLNITGGTLEQVRNTALKAAQILGIEAF